MSQESNDLKEDAHSDFYRERAKDFIELHEQVTASVDLLDSLESFLATFQADLSAVSGQISDLQARSKEFDAKLNGRKKIERPLSQLLSDIVVPPGLVTAILDTPVGEPWLSLIEEFEGKLAAVKARSRVKGAKDLEQVVEGLRIAAATKIRGFFLSMMQPIRTSIATNMHVLQSSVFVKYHRLYEFLQRHAKSVAQEIQRSYVGSARLYYETGFRRYTRSLGYIQTRTTEQTYLIGSSSSANMSSNFVDVERLPYAKLDGPGVTLAFLADDKQHKEPIEALFRSMLMVLMDNATAEYNFIQQFFKEPPPNVPPASPMSRSPAFSPIAPTFNLDRNRLLSGTTDRSSIIITKSEPAISKEQEKEQTAALDAVWKQIMDPAIQYCQTFATSALELGPPVVPLLTIIRITENVLSEVQKRWCPPLEGFFIGLRLSMWPTFQKEMGNHVDGLKKLSDGVGGGYLSRGVTLKDSLIQTIAHRYSTLFSAFIVLSSEDDEAMLFSNLLRLRQELNRLITTQASKVKDSNQSGAYLSSTYEILLHNLSTGPHSATHPKAQAEAAYWREVQETARRRIALTRR